jgi:hypothetical protein
MSNILTRFQADTKNHQVQIVLDQGVHRHLKCQEPGTWCYGFHITTWPGHLCISGDMGCYVFARSPDMFQFFRGERINPQYWSEKLQADSVRSGHKAFSGKVFREAIKRDFMGWRFEEGESRVAAFQDVRNELLENEYSTASEAVGAAMSYKCAVSGNEFVDFLDHDLEEYTHHFLWACHAIQWAIACYDETQERAAA